MSLASNTVYILLGGNLKNVKYTFELARQEITNQAGSVTNQSPLYKSAAWGFESSNDFLNQVIEVKTLLSAPNLLVALLDIEKTLGRTRNTKGFSSRTIDIDILYYNNVILDTKQLTIPHYAIQERMFTLLPLVDLIPDYVHPVLKTTNVKLLETCTDKNIPVQL